MGFFRRLFGGGSPTSTERFVMYYVRPKRCDEIVPVRIDQNNDPSLTDEGGYFVRKVARGERCPFPAELTVSYDSNRRVVEVAVENGERVEEAVYEAWMASK